ncbi:single-stranded DNA-binding protein [Mesoaciditoga lauensis]|uniref:single-stranded DNA-binding protein n=1 Tax=Mesoaciditoga lauensis TaxID=1495039 RepID=UPI00055E1AF2|nr:single-stranded DNA-binding protein [Mesoaciditoga lauensis]
MNYNKVILVGRITHDPELKATTSGTEIVNFQLAVNRYGKDKQADFFRIVCFGRSAEFVSTYVKKGTLLLVEGSLRNNVWEDSTGQKRSNTEIIANRVEIMEKKGSNTFEEAPSTPDEEPEEDIPEINEGEELEGDEGDEIPF